MPNLGRPPRLRFQQEQRIDSCNQTKLVTTHMSCSAHTLLTSLMEKVYTLVEHIYLAAFRHSGLAFRVCDADCTRGEV